MSRTQLGLTDFLNHISRHPYHPTLVERYLSLAFEMPTALRRDAMDHLHRVLVQPNPALALRCSYHYRQYIRHESGHDPEEEIFVLQLIQSCFRELGRYKAVAIIGDEIARISQEWSDKQPPSPPKVSQVYPRPKLVIDAMVELHDVPQNTPEDSYEALGQDLLLEFVRHLGSFPSMRHQSLAMEKLVQGMDALYQKSGQVIEHAIRTYGRNPLIWTKDGDFRPDLALHLVNSRVFQMGKDQYTALRVRMIVEVLTAYYDQPGRRDVDLEEERGARLRLLAEMIHVFLDAGVNFPSLGRVAS
ncbi:hypothetical protein [Oligoflexus tunisiensis]|uniref:hypothetical protein n=1 Tax=Oligoflexus tunisiensis TaxID=708132 RepID=UPI00114D17EB|nr:hypothetical protein [Oligoflexus tunisiensis]